MSNQEMCNKTSVEPREHVGPVSTYFQRSLDSRKHHMRPRTKSPFPPLKRKVSHNMGSLVKQNESFSTAIDKNIIEICSDTKLSPETSMLTNYKMLSYDDPAWKEFAKNKKGKDRDRDLGGSRGTTQQSNPFSDSTNKRHCFSIDKSTREFCDMSAPTSANSLKIGMNRRSRVGSQNIRVKPFVRKETCLPIKIELNKSFINWKAVALNSNDLSQNDKENLGFSPPCHEKEVIRAGPVKASRAFSHETGRKLYKDIISEFNPAISRAALDSLPKKCFDPANISRSLNRQYGVATRDLSSSSKGPLSNKTSKILNENARQCKYRSDYVNYSKYKKQQSIRLYGNSVSYGPNYSINNLTNNSFKEENSKSAKRAPHILEESHRDHSQIIMKGRKVAGLAPIQAGIHVRPKESSLPKCKCEPRNRIKISRCGAKIPFLTSKKCQKNCCNRKNLNLKTTKCPSEKYQNLSCINIKNTSKLVNNLPKSMDTSAAASDCQVDDINPSYYLTFGSRI
ncbi:unnamed protein product [Moneuplotes crassus]|uniref:Uncharacterized protein n=1 Tax=Euplotes crassus TaxID=5936 RepID=A0AAD1X8L6_EUPCR|nr:unnamed protein product [Moneuplotes crassus]